MRNASAMAPERARRLAMLQTVRDLRRSVARGRPMTLPNLLRLLQRRLNQLAPGQPMDPWIEHLRQLYRTHQPFSTPIIRWRD